jgi:hypothetical protein
MSSVLPTRGPTVKFEISAGAAALIRRRGGQLWIWPSPDRHAYATTEPPGDRHEWTECRQGDIVVRVDDAIVPPQRWVVTPPTNDGRNLDARWNGIDPREVFGRLPLVDRPDPQPEPGDARRWYERFAALAGLPAVFWVLGTVGLHRWWFDDLSRLGEVAALLLALIVAAALWVWRHVRRMRVG